MYALCRPGVLMEVSTRCYILKCVTRFTPLQFFGQRTVENDRSQISSILPPEFGVPCQGECSPFSQPRALPALPSATMVRAFQANRVRRLHDNPAFNGELANIRRYPLPFFLAHHF